MNEKEQRTILIIDDNPTNVHVLIKYLEEEGFKTLIAPSGKRALQQLDHFIPDLILLDVMMPGIDGFETCHQIKANEFTNHIPIIFMTALADTVDKLKGFEAGGVDYITKPFNHEEVLARVITHLTIRQLQQQLEAQNACLEEQYAQLKELNASKDIFFSIISHDLKSPFSSLLDLLRLVEEKYDTYEPQKMKTTLTLLRNSAKNFDKLLDNLLTWSRIQRGVIEYQPEEFNIRKVVEHNTALFTPYAAQKKITLKNLIEEELHVYGDHNMIDTVIRNLVSNALKFTRSGGIIEISAHLNERFTEVAISDNGIGIKEENAMKLFRIDERYKRLGTAHEKGTGLGLILCKELVDRNGGCIWVKSEVEQGTSFKFLIPRKPLEF